MGEKISHQEDEEPLSKLTRFHVATDDLAKYFVSEFLMNISNGDRYCVIRFGPRIQMDQSTAPNSQYRRSSHCFSVLLLDVGVAAIEILAQSCRLNAVEHRLLFLRALIYKGRPTEFEFLNEKG